jgi:hypothetical protein
MLAHEPVGRNRVDERVWLRPMGSLSASCNCRYCLQELQNTQSAMRLSFVGRGRCWPRFCSGDIACALLLQDACANAKKIAYSQLR